MIQTCSIDLPQFVLSMTATKDVVLREAAPRSTSDSTTAVFDLPAECDTGEGSSCGVSTSTEVSPDVLEEDWFEPCLDGPSCSSSAGEAYSIENMCLRMGSISMPDLGDLACLRIWRSWRYAKRTEATARVTVRTPNRIPITEMAFGWLGLGSAVAAEAAWL
jgi:hypothetical protein